MEHEYILMNKNKPVLNFLYDREMHHVTKLTGVSMIEFAPPAILNHKGKPDKFTVDSWLKERTIPASRAHIRELIDALPQRNLMDLMWESFGLSLSDCYWINDTENPQDWSKINFFDNDFAEDLGLLTLNAISSENPDLYSPNATLNGDLRKKWTIVQGERLLVKSGSGVMNQEVYNEVIASDLHKRLLRPDDYVPYKLHKERNHTYCACPNMLRKDEELVPMWDLIKYKKKPNHMNDYQFILSICESLDIKEAESWMAKMFTCDYILANSDRHYGNFGLIRNVETLEYIRMAPVYDTGTCLWCRQEQLFSLQDYEYTAKPFGKNGMKRDEQLGLFHKYGWFDETALKGFADDALKTLALNQNMSEKRLDAIRRGLDRNIETVIGHKRKNR